MSFTLYTYQLEINQRPKYKARNFETTAQKRKEYTGICKYRQYLLKCNPSASAIKRKD
jgi:hypothetical protein